VIQSLDADNRFYRMFAEGRRTPRRATHLPTRSESPCLPSEAFRPDLSRTALPATAAGATGSQTMTTSGHVLRVRGSAWQAQLGLFSMARRATADTKTGLWVGVAHVVRTATGGERSANPCLATSWMGRPATVAQQIGSPATALIAVRRAIGCADDSEWWPLQRTTIRTTCSDSSTRSDRSIELCSLSCDKVRRRATGCGTSFRSFVASERAHDRVALA